MKKYKCIFLFALCAGLLFTFSACDKTGSNTTTQTTTTTLGPGPHSTSLIYEEISVAAKTNHVISFFVDNDMKEVRVEGKFQTVDGRPNIETYIMDDATYSNWLKGLNVATILYDSGQKSVGFVNQSITVPGKYHLIFTNWSSTNYAISQPVFVNFDLKWSY